MSSNQDRAAWSEGPSDDGGDAFARRLIEAAKAGDVAAAELLFSLAIGEPMEFSEMIEPDEIDPSVN